MSTPLRLHHELLLLALCDRTGKVLHGERLGFGLGGALLTELLLAERVVIEQEQGLLKRRWLVVRDATPFGEPVLDAALAKFAHARRRAQVSVAVSRLANLPRLRHHVAAELCARGVLRETEEQVLLLFRRRRYPTVDPKPERALVQRVRGVLDGGRTPDTRTAALIGLANLTGTLRVLYDGKALRALKPRLKSIEESQAGSRAAREAVAAAQAALMAATVAIVAAS